MKWSKLQAGWYMLWSDDTQTSPSLAAITQDRVGSTIMWCVYVHEDMPPGDSQHKTLAEAKREAERRVKT